MTADSANLPDFLTNRDVPRSFWFWESPTAHSEWMQFVHCDHEYLTFGGDKFSKSWGAAGEVPYFLSKCSRDPLRYHLTATDPVGWGEERARRRAGM